MEKIQFKLDAFEGPLDLLLFLISKHKLDIADIEISKLLEQYLDFIALAQAHDLELASEFLAMAARLVYIKTVALLPRHEEESDLKKELEGQLLEYQLCKLMSQRLIAMNVGNDIFVRKGAILPADKEYKKVHNKEDLLDAYLVVVGKAKRKLPPSKTSFSGIVSKRMVSVTSKIIYVLKKLYKTGEIGYDEFFLTSERSELVATFLALLELIKSKRITISDDNTCVYFSRERM
ncbi:MAG: segregation/condensation protein A [Oscillospiraceae bacterium]